MIRTVVSLRPGGIGSGFGRERRAHGRGADTKAAA